MKRLFSIVVLSLITALQLPAADDVTVEAVMAKDKDGEPTETFAVDVPKVYAFFKSKGTKKGDKIRAVFIAEDVGDAAPADTKIDEVAITAKNDDENGSFSLSKPDKGWPKGEYRVDIYVGDSTEPAASEHFDIGTSDDSSSE